MILLVAAFFVPPAAVFLILLASSTIYITLGLTVGLQDACWALLEPGTLAVEDIAGAALCGSIPRGRSRPGAPMANYLYSLVCMAMGLLRPNDACSDRAMKLEQKVHKQLAILKKFLIVDAPGALDESERARRAKLDDLSKTRRTVKFKGTTWNSDVRQIITELELELEDRKAGIMELQTSPITASWARRN
ncbi:hypothetical protein B0H17DRAFT_1174209 [Mycena rosella]|uniref:Uncharacterized protein n=1 Tax=Mycena rosella TaxID=1033263 RepID=A0AAD7MB57_MYCRO|nr:hypothetical protein B0H17DRAFT_1174209 [Mycena rosella]